MADARKSADRQRPVSAAVFIRPKRHKYAAKACVVEGIRFPSRREGDRYRDLRLLEQAGAIADLERQPSFDLHAPGGVRVCRYVADFRYRDRATSAVVVEDAKGVRTPVYRLKKKWLQLEHGITVREV